ncbi:cupin domain-containing protein [Lewinella sp. LCG006]|uniref:cupin domain-containing protein n=1 Tax=Lewinella sp. LCG006 TaxID=3231911 RepID=UPI003460DE04
MQKTATTSHTANKGMEFEDLISPIGIDKFVERYWEQESLILHRHEHSYYQDILSMDVLDNILDLPVVEKDRFRVVKHQKLVDQEKYLNKDGSVNLNKLYMLYADGFSVSLRRIDLHWSPIKQLCFNLRQTINHEVKANMYLTPKHSAAFNPHIDAHDVIILQIAGSKNWKLYDTIIETPLVDSPTPSLPPAALRNVREVTLNAGDFMYLPRGVPHEAYTTNNSSLHLTIGVFPLQWMDLLIKAINLQSHRDVNLRKALPLGYLNNADGVEEMNDRLQNILDQTLKSIQGMNFRYFHESYRNEFMNKLAPLGNGHFSQLDKLELLSLSTVLRKRSGMVCSVQVLGSACRILYNRNVIKGPATLAPAMQFVADIKHSFRVSDLPVGNDKHKLAIAAKMIRGGLLETA